MLTFIQAFVLSFPTPTLPPYQKFKNYDYQKESVCPLKESGEEELEDNRVIETVFYEKIMNVY